MGVPTAFRRQHLGLAVRKVAWQMSYYHLLIIFVIKEVDAQGVRFVVIASPLQVRLKKATGAAMWDKVLLFPLGQSVRIPGSLQ